ncbi:response regulator transcription factor [Aquabacterium sp. A08]|uniref:response regulator transcription factor n=1 Tax=Aquabacterium sp. A08 TaxID=2718532 RepID=UPI00141EBFAC|nr:response regulator transcription factor [Aquabacterium sp. A08]NIC41286.1 response regulator transcription factor [Aquabacterium sp. A08]NIC41298.1 response regulator transcription factor [Aquabacterium sp. A08]NIC42427.1 response regulator transcription factor [Aquabacterium sp. A08]
MNILVIEDNDSLRHATVQMLNRNGHRASGLVCAEDIDDMPLDPAPDLYLIDLNLPGEDGLSLSRRLRAAQPYVGIIMVTARGQVDDKLAGYESGADIYLPKPVDPAELLAAVCTLGRRLDAPRPATGLPQASAFRVELATRTLHGPNGTETLSESELSTLTGLSRAKSRRLETWQIMHMIGVDPETYSKASLEVRMVRLRQKLHRVGAPTGAIPPVRGYGYRLDLDLQCY